MVSFVIVSLLVLFIVVLLSIVFIVSRLFVYTLNLEEEIKKNIEIQQNLLQSLKEVVGEGIINTNGRFVNKKIQKIKKPIFVN